MGFGCLGCPSRLSPRLPSPWPSPAVDGRFGGEGNLPTPPRLPSALLPVRPWVSGFAGKVIVGVVGLHQR